MFLVFFWHSSQKEWTDSKVVEVNTEVANFKEKVVMDYNFKNREEISNLRPVKSKPFKAQKMMILKSIFYLNFYFIH